MFENTRPILHRAALHFLLTRQHQSTEFQVFAANLFHFPMRIWPTQGVKKYAAR